MASSNSNEFQVYINQCIQLASTLTIKSQESLDGLNQYVKDYYGLMRFDETEPTTWKYYMNVAGQYHFTDTPMQVKSLDSMQIIDFTVENLKVHTATAAAYQFGTWEYYQLVTQYPKQVFLILGIIYPVEVQSAISAADGDILGWPASLIEPNEFSLVQKLQGWIKAFKNRWFNPQYGISDELYFTVQNSNLYYGLAMAIISYRLAACGTAEAHSYHVRQYLASHLGLDAYYDQLTLAQSIWLYRNINYIERNAGKQSTFRTLIQKLLTDRGIPLAAYVMNHNVSDMPDSLYPAIEFDAIALNLGYNAVADTTWTLDQMLDNEQPVAVGNALVQTDVEANIQTRMENSRSNTLQTKVLNSAMIDMSGSSPYTLEDILLHHWAFFASKDLYTAFLVVNNPVTGEPIVPMTAKDGFAFMIYCFCQSVGFDLTNEPVPSVIATRVQRIPTPPIADLMSVVDSGLVTQDIALEALSWQPAIVPMISVHAFCATANAIWQAATNQWKLIAFQEHEERRGMVFGMVERIYSDNVIQLGDGSINGSGETYAQWFRLRNIDITVFSADDYGLMYQSLIEAATGVNLQSTHSVANLQAAMLSMMQKLSSYSIQFISGINDSTIRDVGSAIIRTGDNLTASVEDVYDGDTEVDVIRHSTLARVHFDYDINAARVGQIGNRLEASAQSSVKERIGLVVRPARDPIDVYGYVSMQGIDVRSTIRVSTGNPVIPPLIGIENWLALSDTDRAASIVSIWPPPWQTPGAPLPQLPDIWPVRNLGGLTYTPPSD
ncbi:hypothetical protein HDG34_003176 [Paraburkholderia sp. HC6.4b]|uniref:hypothetical protein n=1 Tax=unclassified Paraburkholderia TaxID=2615204 RepID=UPI001614480F|nr:MULTISPECIES: hypothetical protein [unclassified Paraburkholderia]MBB5409235.1 hypothetical protein [Paraburkholderia sp. HC6.4b]MBB5450963.1 hypothetical protein [Paraburkholderia sp. Kb1A]